MREKKEIYVQPEINVHKIDSDGFLTASGTKIVVKNDKKNTNEPPKIQKTNKVEETVLNNKSFYPNINMPFVFKAVSFEEYCSGMCTGRGQIDLTITATISDEAINFKLNGLVPKGIQNDFSILLMNSLVMEDRIQYGNIPYNMNDYVSDYPKVCNLFKTGTCIRFAMVNPLRIIEFNGRYI